MTKVFTTTTWKKIVIEFQWWTEKFNFYFNDVKLYYNTKDYSDFWDLEKRQVEYLQWRYEDTEKNENLEKMKLDNIIVWFNIVDYRSNGCRISISDTYECDGFLIFDKTATDEYIQYVLKCLNKWWNGEIYCVWVYIPTYYKATEKDEYWNYNYIKAWKNIDYCDWFFDFEEAKNSYEKVIDASEMDNFYEYEWMSELEYRRECEPEKYNEYTTTEKSMDDLRQPSKE